LENLISDFLTDDARSSSFSDEKSHFETAKKIKSLSQGDDFGGYPILRSDF